MPSKIPVGEKIRLARLARKYSLRQFSEIVGMKHQSISFFETGRQSPTVDQYEKIQAALGYDLESDVARAAFSFFLNNTSPINRTG